MSDTPQLAISLVTWNSLIYLPQLFASLDAQEYKYFRIMAVDNASSDGTLPWLTQRVSAYAEHGVGRLCVLRNVRNHGFARAQNQAMMLLLSHWPDKIWSRQYVLVMNPDIELAPSCLRELIQAMESDTSLAACGPKLLRAFRHTDEDHQTETERSVIIDSTGVCMTRARRAYDRGAGEEDRGQYDQQTEVFGLSGACAVFRASALAELRCGTEIFDEDFFAYQEDVDLAWRMRRFGMKLRMVPQAVAWHHRSAPSLPHGSWMDAWRLRRSKPPFVNHLSTRNHLWLLWKNESWRNLLLHSPWIVPYETAKFFTSITSRAEITGYFSAVVGWWKMWKKRRILRRRASISSDEMRAWFI